MRILLRTTLALMCLFAGLQACVAERGREGEGRSSERQSPGGEWSERAHQGGQNQAHHSYSNPEGAKTKSTESSASARATEGSAGSQKRDPSSQSGAKDAAAGAAHANRNSPQYSGKQG